MRSMDILSINQSERERERERDRERDRERKKNDYAPRGMLYKKLVQFWAILRLDLSSWKRDNIKVKDSKKKEKVYNWYDMNSFKFWNDNLYFCDSGWTPMKKGAWPSENSANYCFYSERERERFLQINVNKDYFDYLFYCDKISHFQFQ